jgi:hypothetical protein
MLAELFHLRPLLQPFSPQLQATSVQTATVTVITAPTSLTPTLETTPTLPLTPTVPVTPTVPPTPLPTPTPPMAWNPQSWTQTTGWSPSFHLPMLILGALLLIAAAIAYFYLRQVRFKGHGLHTKLAERASYITAGAGALGLLLALFGYARTPVLGLPLLLVLWLAILVGLAVFGAYYFLRLYPQRLADYELEEKKKKYLPKPKAKPASRPAPTSAPKKKGARKRRR